jgi:hypothetical protein
MSKVSKEYLLSQLEEFISSISENDKQRLLNSLATSSQLVKTSKDKKRTSDDIEVRTSNNYTHTGYRRHADGRSTIYERRKDVKNLLANYNYTIPYEKKKGYKNLKASMFFNQSSYGEAISRAWNTLADNKNTSVKEIQKKIDEIFKDFIK